MEMQLFVIPFLLFVILHSSGILQQSSFIRAMAPWKNAAE